MNGVVRRGKPLSYGQLTALQHARWYVDSKVMQDVRLTLNQKYAMGITCILKDNLSFE